MKGIYKIADEIVEIETLYPDTQEMLADYVWAGESNPTDNSNRTVDIIRVKTTEEEISEEQAMSDEEMRYEGLPEIQYPKGYLETLAVYRKICAEMASRGVILMHGSVIAVDGEAYLFTAASGTGKSTHVRLWRKMFGERAVMVNDDKPLIRVQSGKVTVYGTPWDGKHRLSTNMSCPLKAICILERGEVNEIHKITPKDAFPMLIQQSYRPDEPLGFMQAMDLLGEVAQNVGLYRLHCNMNDEAAKIAYEGMQGGKV